MSRSMSYCTTHGEYMEFGPTYGCPECESEATVTPAPEADEWREVAQARLVMIEEAATRIAELEAEVERLRRSAAPIPLDTPPADHRLGLPQPDGEPCTPMSARAWRWLA